MNVTLSPHHGLPGMAHSSAARAAVENLTRVLSIEWARFGIRLTALAAGQFATETLMTKYPKQVVEGVAGTVPLGRLGTEEEFAWLVAYLASPAGDYRLGRGAHDRRRARQLVRRLAARAGSPTRAASRWPRSGGRSRDEVPELRTERLLMRGFRDEDYERWAEISADPRSAPGSASPTGLTPHEAWLDMAMLSGHWELRGFGHWALEELETGELVGRAGLYYPPDWPGIEVGWTVAREHWGKGYAPEAARAACAWAHDGSGVRPHRQPHRTPATSSRSASPRSSARRSRAGTARAASTCSCTASDLPLIDSPS